MFTKDSKKTLLCLLSNNSTVWQHKNRPYYLIKTEWDVIISDCHLSVINQLHCATYNAVLRTVRRTSSRKILIGLTFCVTTLNQVLNSQALSGALVNYLPQSDRNEIVSLLILTYSCSLHGWGEVKTFLSPLLCLGYLN